MSAGMLTGRPAEEMPGSAGDLLSELSHLHEQVRQVMQGVPQALLVVRLPARGCCGACGEAQRSAEAILIMEDISLPTGCQRSLGHVEDAIYQGRPKSHGRGRTCMVKWRRNSR